jgi:hypothetical protein
MPWYETPPFERGKTWMNAFPPTFDPLDQVGSTGFYTPALNLEGKVFMFPDTIYGTGVPVIVRLVRNNSGQAQANASNAITGATAVTMQPGRLVVFDPAFPRMRVCQYSQVAGQEAYPVDELLPTTGVSPGDLFYIVISGPALCYTGGTTMGVGLFFGDWVAANTAVVTGATSAATDGGGVAALTGITSTSTNIAQMNFQYLENFNMLGRVIGTPAAALSSATTTGTTALTASQTNTSIVVMVESGRAW